jgi:tetratricopeptide (TPR) repeat protein
MNHSLQWLRGVPPGGLRFVTFVSLWLLTASACGENVDTAVQTSSVTLEGRYVIVVRSGVEMRAEPDGNGSKVVGRVHDLSLQVRKVKGDDLAVRSSGTDGWIKKSDVVPYEQAVEHFTNRIRENPKDGYAHAGRAVARQGTGAKEDDMLADLNEAIRLNPQLAVAFEQRGYIAYGRKEYDKSLADLNEAIRLDPETRWPYHVRGWIWYRKKDYDKALADYEQALRIDPKEAVFYRDRGNIAFARREYDKALADYSTAIQHNPKYSVPFLQRGKTWAQKKDYEKALADFHEVVRLDPKRSSGYTALAWLLATCPDAKYRDGRKAVETARRAFELTQGHEELATLAAAYAEAGDFGEAVTCQSKAVEQAPSELKSEFQKRIELYKSMRPFRQE